MSRRVATALALGSLAVAMASAPAAAGVAPHTTVRASVVAASTVVSSPGTRHAVATALTATPSPAAASRTIEDPRGDVARAQVDILSGRIDYTRTRLSVTLQFVTVRPSTSYAVSIDPGRVNHGGWFSLVDGRLYFEDKIIPNSDQARFRRVRCAGLRSVTSTSRDRLQVSLPVACMARYAPLTAGAWFGVTAFSGKGDNFVMDFLGEQGRTVRVSRG